MRETLAHVRRGRMRRVGKWSPVSVNAAIGTRSACIVGGTWCVVPFAR